MRRFLVENISILKNAIGVEPVGQIFMNVIRKCLGMAPRHWNEEQALLGKGLHAEASIGQVINVDNRSNYDKYLYNRSIAFNKRTVVSPTKNLSMALVWLVPSADTMQVKEILQSIGSQKSAFDNIYIVNPGDIALGDERLGKQCATLNEACEKCTEEYVFILKDVALLNDSFVQECQHYIRNHPNGDLYYTCDDVLDKKGQYGQPKFKPEFNQYLLYSNNYIGSNIIVRRTFGAQLDWFDATFKDAFVYDFILRSSERKGSIERIEEVLLHRYSISNEEDLVERKRILQNHLIRTKDFAKVVDGIERGTTRLQRSSSTKTLVSIVIPFKDQVKYLKKCVGSILEKTKYKNYEIILANNGSKLEETKSYLSELTLAHQSISVCDIDIPFNFSRLNNIAVDQSRGDYLLFLNNDTEVISESWLETMVAELEREDVGVVGAKLLYEDDTVQHAGVILGIGHVAGHVFRNFKDTESGQLSRANATQEYLAVTGACLLTKKEIFVKVNKFDEEHLAVSNNDVDYCLKVVDLGYKVIYTPFAKLYHFESKSRSSDLAKTELERYKKEVIYMKDKWGAKYGSDPFFHPHLDSRYENLKYVKEIA